MAGKGMACLPYATIKAADNMQGMPAILEIWNLQWGVDQPSSWGQYLENTQTHQDEEAGPECRATENSWNL